VSVISLNIKLSDFRFAQPFSFSTSCSSGVELGSFKAGKGVPENTCFGVNGDPLSGSSQTRASRLSPGFPCYNRAVNKYAHFQQPEAEFDFHDRGILDGPTVKHMTEDFVQECRKKGLRRIRIITGKGKQGAPLVRPQVLRTLEALRRDDIVATFGDTKITEGGHGAVDVVLAPD
jgi:hypothetical protein